MKKNLALLLAAVMTVGCVFTGCGSNAKETKAETAGAVEERTTLTVGFDASFPPYGYQEDGEYVWCRTKPPTWNSLHCPSHCPPP